MPKPVILVIDDEPMWRNLLDRLLNSADYKVYTAATCADGIRMAGLYQPDCILLDFNLGDGTAVEVCSAIRSNKNIKKTPIIIFSSDPDAAISCYTQCKADKFIPKGLPLPELLTVIEGILRGAQCAASNE
ncbi:MAG: hypothetical protein A2X34_02740 [Elusimicrobia bacterium GWC2_51_8]|nr:MAG: hypothetical protein A2X33_03045 [Elusimicrobia bacterium GWA2_51_34]OGR58772.1 MAG: hypothetical protein A2X34_02740 [Elusimicrobia bacterium GWC2_51_8]HAF94991.1 hypothetical protein [Elusimicrobiota bacterium]HCE99099.1 hypothetical protein [Elusimicrobiota bacterium]